jgi:hypothetical protein
VNLEIVRNHDGDTTATCGASNGRTHLFAEHIGGTSRSNSAIKPAIAPIEQAKAIHLAVVSRSLDQALPASPFAAPDTSKRRVKGELHLILKIQVGLRQQSEQSSKIGGKLIQEISLDQRLDG